MIVKFVTLTTFSINSTLVLYYSE